MAVSGCRRILPRPGDGLLSGVLPTVLLRYHTDTRVQGLKCCEVVLQAKLARDVRMLPPPRPVRRRLELSIKMVDVGAPLVEVRVGPLFGGSFFAVDTPCLEAGL